MNRKPLAQQSDYAPKELVIHRVEGEKYDARPLELCFGEDVGERMNEMNEQRASQKQRRQVTDFFLMRFLFSQ